MLISEILMVFMEMEITLFSSFIQFLQDWFLIKMETHSNKEYDINYHFSFQLF